ncbi:MAG: sigma-70 family RNA polymerase sigma factor [Streptosporangiales bacterium]|nr:sigma-70 family RNA polymerase sigma factor [Streptosporangiales bacterium]
MSLSAAEVDVFEGARPRLAAIAYRMLGSAAEAEDVVQETFLRWQAADRSLIRVPEAWLTKVATNLSLNELSSARVRRETYVGEWLPEPVPDGDPMLGPDDTVAQRESVSFAVLVLLERLTPAERAVYVLREAFGYPHKEVAEILDISEANSQQLHRRARLHLDRERADTQVDRATSREIAREFLAAASGGAIEPLIRLLTEDAVGVGDGGGKVPARAKAFFGAVMVAKFLRGLFRPSDAKRALVGGGMDLYADMVNGSPAIVALVGDQVVGVMMLEVRDGRIAAVRNQVNPDKLAYITRRWQATEHGEPVGRAW